MARDCKLWEISAAGSPSMEGSLLSWWCIGCPQPTVQYGQIERVTCVPALRARSDRVRSFIASRPVPSEPTINCWTCSHFNGRFLSIQREFLLRRLFSLALSHLSFELQKAQWQLPVSGW
jgi:hypothetical protein